MGEWNADLYDGKHGFVAEYGRGLLSFVPKGKGRRILDLGYARSRARRRNEAV